MSYVAEQSPKPEPQRDYERVAVELIRAVRGRRSCAALSRRAGYLSNAVQRWEARQAWPTAARFLTLCESLRSAEASWIERFYNQLPAWAPSLEPTSPEAVAAFLRSLKGDARLVTLATLVGHNRFSVSRWFEGTAEPKLPDFLRLVDAASGRLLDLIAALVDPATLPSLRKDWDELLLAREAAYDVPWSHGVLRALELNRVPDGVASQKAWLMRTLKLDRDRVDEALQTLLRTSQIEKSRKGHKVKNAGAKVDTSDDPIRARALKAAWTRTALERLENGDAGRFGYAVFSVSEKDLGEIQKLHLAYVRAVQGVIASSSPSECVGLYCSQLLNLSGRDID